ncbi:MAG: hypothetical protein H5T96_09755 [Tissierellales bacterium]|nr:hypothetical protein [Tissierellales bacterium]
MKVCTNCKEEKDVNGFSKDKNREDGRDPWCKKCKSEYKTSHYHTKEGLATQIFVHQKAKSKKRGHDLPSYTKCELKEWLFNHEDFPRLFSEWENNNFDKNHTPSIDRLDDYLPYSFNNIKLVKWKVNNDKGSKDIVSGKNRKYLKPVVSINKETGKINKFYSIAQAYRETGISKCTIIDNCKGKRNTNRTFNPYIWYYEKDYNATIC